jgi:drug/metabolite transporter (DMT)-like permease
LLAREGVVGILGQGGYLLGVFRAADLGVPPGTSALVASLQPPLLAALLWVGSGDRTDRRQSLGLLTGLVGVLLVVGGDLGGAGGSAGLAAMGFGMLSLTAATLVATRWPQPDGYGVMDSLVVQGTVALGFFAAVALATGTAAPPRDPDFWVAIVWLVVLAFVGGYGSYLYVLRTTGPVVVSAWLYLTPATAAVWAWAMFGEPLTARAAVGFLVAAAGVAAVVRPQRPASPDRRAPTPARAGAATRRDDATSPAARPAAPVRRAGPTESAGN